MSLAGPWRSVSTLHWVFLTRPASLLTPFCLSSSSTMSFQDIETGLAQRPLSPGGAPQSAEESAFVTLQSSLSLQVFKINSNVQGILKLVDQLGTARDSAALRKSL